VEPRFQEKWKKVRRSLLWGLILGVAGSATLAYYLWGASSVLTTELALLCLALGFWVTEMLVGVFTRVKTANASAVGFLFVAKLAWWGALFVGAKRIPPGHDKAVALGVGTFLLALVFSTLQHYGMPKISDAENPRDP
jgi:hypothetical protein